MENPVKTTSVLIATTFFENNMIKENKLLKDNLTQIQQKLLQAEKKLKKLEEEIKVKEKTI